ncbi:DUF2169 domain-containing protein [Archangium sp.]|uniref:DUF2169 family type VI secretion system accessory protein n=1 Tax=Archangium sp. TaxID=1872627 RepID=UPI002D420A15|nr:DUF2169 domain-containing protein [Archangium sp.]HYO56796.1 DUF2169 domain-containing protein [Archangium sp.]
MQITTNTTGMEAGIAVAADKDARDHCVVVVKGTFQTDSQGHMTLGASQRPLVYVDEHYGEPDTTAIRYECDFALEKRLTDVLVVGKAIAPRGKHVTELPVRLEVQGKAKDILVVGERRWLRTLGSVHPCAPVPFTEMPLTFDRAFGGQDDSKGLANVAVEQSNPVGVGFNPYREGKKVEGMSLPNLEHPMQRLTSYRDRVDPVGFGCIGRNWKARVDYAGTYDQRWRDEVAPFLPADFDSRYFQSAPADQQFPMFEGGEVIRCVHMAARPVVEYRIPSLKVPVSFGFVGDEVERFGALDTVILEPHLSLAVLVWRASAPLGKKLHTLRSIAVGEQPHRTNANPQAYRHGKPFFKGLSEAVRWLRQRREGSR